MGALPKLLRAARSDPDFGVRVGALGPSETWGRAPEGAVPLLRRLLRDPDGNIRRIAEEALGSVQGARTR